MGSENQSIPLIEDVTGVILAGGKSSRYGRNKAFVEIDGTPLIELVTQVMQSVFRHLLLVTNTPHEYSHLGFPMQTDLIKGLGPIGGILTALTHLSNHWGFFVACDMPFLNQKLIRHIVAVRDDFDAVVPLIAGKMEMLHTLFHRRCLFAVRETIDAGQYQAIRFLPKVAVQYVREPELRFFDSDLSSFQNVNHPRELDKLLTKDI